jgi:uncharacterized protein (UPF0261 family)
MSTPASRSAIRSPSAPPARGLSMYDKESDLFYSPEEDAVFIETLKKRVKPEIEIKEIDAHINDEAFAVECAAKFLELMKMRK